MKTYILVVEAGERAVYHGFNRQYFKYALQGRCTGYTLSKLPWTGQVLCIL